MLDSELKRRKPVERSHRKVVKSAVMNRKLFCKVVQRVKAVAGIEAFLVLSVAAFPLAVVAGGVGTDELVADAQFRSSRLKESW